MADRLDSPRRAQQPSEIPPYQPRDWSGVGYPDPDIIALAISPVHALQHADQEALCGDALGGGAGLEWRGSLMWSDIPNDRQPVARFDTAFGDLSYQPCEWSGG